MQCSLAGSFNRPAINKEKLLKIGVASEKCIDESVEYMDTDVRV